MGWFNPNTACGCCGQDPCGKTCETRVESGKTIRTYDSVDLLECECVSAITGEVELRTSYNMTFSLTGTATGQTFSWSPLTTPTTTDIDLTGTYSHSVALEARADGSCGIGSTVFNEVWLVIHSEFLETNGGDDYYAIIAVNIVNLRIAAGVLNVGPSGTVPADLSGLSAPAGNIGDPPSNTITWCETPCGCTYTSISEGSVFTLSGSTIIWGFGGLEVQGTQDDLASFL